MRRCALLFGSALLLASAPGCGDDDGNPPGTDGGTPADGAVGDGSTGDAGATVDCSMRPSAAPETRGEVAGVLDAARQRLVVFGGNTRAPVSCMPMYAPTAEIWAFHLDCNSWEQLMPGGGPGARSRVAVALDTMRNRMLVFGGRRQTAFDSITNFNEVWAFDLASDTWEQLTTSGTGPTARSAAAAVYDATKDRLLVFGGDTRSFMASNGFFALDLATNEWSQITATGGPTARLYHSAAVVGREMVVYGGTPNFDGPFFGDAFAFDMDADTWRSVATSGPDERFGAALLGDSAGGRALLVGGHDGTAMGNRNDVQALDVGAGTWAEVRPGDTLNGVPGGLCDFPADFTIPEDGAPERRYAFAASQDATTGYFFGGKTDCGNVNDVWTLSFATGTWRKLRPSTGGEACNRTGATSCSTLCF